MCYFPPDASRFARHSDTAEEVETKADDGVEGNGGGTSPYAFMTEEII